MSAKETFEPSASTYVCSPRKSVSLRVFVRIKVNTDISRNGHISRAAINDKVQSNGVVY